MITVCRAVIYVEMLHFHVGISYLRTRAAGFRWKLEDLIIYGSKNAFLDSDGSLATVVESGSPDPNYSPEEDSEARRKGFKAKLS